MKLIIAIDVDYVHPGVAPQFLHELQVAQRVDERVDIHVGGSVTGVQVLSVAPLQPFDDLRVQTALAYDEADELSVEEADLAVEVRALDEAAKRLGLLSDEPWASQAYIDSGVRPYRWEALGA